MDDDGVKLIKPGQKYVGAQGVTYSAGVSRKTAGAEKVCMNVLPMAPGVRSKPHIHTNIETIADMLEALPSEQKRPPVIAHWHAG